MEKIRDLISQHLKSAQVYSPEEAQRKSAQLRVDTYNMSVGNYSGYDCPKCQNRGDFAVLKEDGFSFYMRDCTCMKIRSCIRKMEKSGLNDIIRKYTFDSYTCTEAWQQTIQRKSTVFASAPNGWFLLCGQSGSGKTHLCTAICRQLLLDDYEVFYMPWREDISTLKGLSTGSEDREQLLQQIKSAAVLYIDDLFKNGADKDGSSSPTKADIEIAFELLNYRYNKHLVTIISTERSPHDLLDIDQALGSRIIERAGENVLFVTPNRSRNYRLRNITAL